MISRLKIQNNNLVLGNCGPLWAYVSEDRTTPLPCDLSLNSRLTRSLAAFLDSAFSLTVGISTGSILTRLS